MRSPHAHALIRAIDTGAAQRYPGVHAVFTLADLAPLLAQERLPLQFRTAQLPPDITPLVLAKDEVAFVGEAVAVVIAQTRYIAEDAAALVAVDYETLPAVSDCRQALATGSAACPSRPRQQSPDRVPAVLRRHRRRVRASSSSRQRETQAASRRRAFDRRTRRDCGVRRQRGPAHAMVVDAARARGARLPDDAAAARRKSAARGRARRRRRLRRQVRHVSGGGHAGGSHACCCAARSNGSKTGASIFSPRSRSVISIGISTSPSMPAAASWACAGR